MKKSIALFVLLAVLVGLLAGCGSEPEGSGITGEEVLSNFEEMLQPIADQFQLFILSKTELDEGRTCQALLVNDLLTGRSFHIHIYCTQTGEVYCTAIDTDNQRLTYLEFALLSKYLYDSMALPDMDAQAFYDHFNMLSQEPLGEMVVNGWEMHAFYTSSYLHFYAMHESAPNND